VKRVRSCGVTEYYEVLAIAREADDAEVKKAYRKVSRDVVLKIELMLIWHF
jgi:DnaJ family protein B protein 12